MYRRGEVWLSREPHKLESAGSNPAGGILETSMNLTNWILHKANRALSESYWSSEDGGQQKRRPLWAVVVWRCRHWIPNTYFK